MTNSPTLALTKPQQKFLRSTARYPAFVAGFGAGKSEIMAYSAIGDASHSATALIGLYAPTYDLIRLITAPRMITKLEALGVPHKYNKLDNVIYTSFPRMGDFILRTMDNPERIVGYETYCSHVDELDTMKTENARKAWNQIIARNRQSPKGIKKPFNRVSAYTTPEGFRFVYDRWVTHGGGDYEITQAPTDSNPMLPDGYIQSLRDSYPEGLIEAYLEGKFVNLTSGTVYRNYDRAKHRSKETIRDKEVLHIGQDFNVGNMASAIFVQRPNGWHGVGEIMATLDTPEMLHIVKERYADHKCIFYPDASGKSRKSNDASQTDLSLIKDAGHTVKARPANPPVKDRILSVNNAYAKGMLWINDTAAPTVAAAQEQQAYAKNGEPDKTTGHDHANDATGYFVHWNMPVNKPRIIGI